MGGGAMGQAADASGLHCFPLRLSVCCVSLLCPDRSVCCVSLLCPDRRDQSLACCS